MGKELRCKDCGQGSREYCLLTVLSEDSFSDLAHISNSIHYEKGETLFQQGDPVHSLYIICDGFVKLGRRTLEGKNQALIFCGPGTFAGATVIMSPRKQYILYAKCLTHVKSIPIPKRCFLEWLNNDPLILKRVAEQCAQNFNGLAIWASFLAYKSLKERLIYVFQQIGRHYIDRAVENEIICPFPLSRRDLAEAIGSAYETTVAQLREFEAQGLIKISASSIELSPRIFNMIVE
mgnify:CR=1 FL=1